VNWAYSLAALLLSAAAASAAQPRLIAPNDEGRLPAEVVRQCTSADGRTARVVLRTKTGIFRVELADFSAARYEKLVLVVQMVKTWEGIQFTPRGQGAAAAIDLRDSPGVTIRADGPDCRIELDRERVRLLERGGQFQFVDAYR
jgi:hypothetical protein